MVWGRETKVNRQLKCQRQQREGESPFHSHVPFKGFTLRPRGLTQHSGRQVAAKGPSLFVTWHSQLCFHY